MATCLDVCVCEYIITTIKIKHTKVFAANVTTAGNIKLRKKLHKCFLLPIVMNRVFQKHHQTDGNFGDKKKDGGKQEVNVNKLVR